MHVRHAHIIVLCISNILKTENWNPSIWCGDDDDYKTLVHMFTNGIVLFSRKNYMSNLTQMFRYDVSKRTKIHRRYNYFTPAWHEVANGRGQFTSHQEYRPLLVTLFVRSPPVDQSSLSSPIKSTRRSLAASQVHNSHRRQTRQKGMACVLVLLCIAVVSASVGQSVPTEDVFPMATGKSPGKAIRLPIYDLSISNSPCP